jgi:hypothetical protein
MMSLEEIEYWQQWLEKQQSENYGVFVHFSFMALPNFFHYINLN